LPVFPNSQPTGVVAADVGFEWRKFVTRYLLCEQSSCSRKQRVFWSF
jgi:hypothetical protein